MGQWYSLWSVGDVRDEVAVGCRVLGAAAQSDLVWGHLSARDPDGRGVWMKASTYSFEEIHRGSVILVDRDGTVVEGDGRRHAEYPIHTEIMAARADVGAVVHTHSPAAVALGASGQPLLPVSHEATLFVPPDVARFSRTGDLILTRELGAGLAAALGRRNAALMVNHGIVVVGEDIRTAVVSTILLDRACRMMLDVLAVGGAKHWSSDEEALAKREHCYPDALITQAWEYLRRTLA